MDIFGSIVNSKTTEIFTKFVLYSIIIINTIINLDHFGVVNKKKTK